MVRSWTKTRSEAEIQGGLGRRIAHFAPFASRYPILLPAGQKVPRKALVCATVRDREEQISTTQEAL